MGMAPLMDMAPLIAPAQFFAIFFFFKAQHRKPTRVLLLSLEVGLVERSVPSDSSPEIPSADTDADSAEASSNWILIFRRFGLRLRLGSSITAGASSRVRTFIQTNGIQKQLFKFCQINAPRK